MIKLTNYDSSNGDAYSIIFPIDDYDVLNNNGVSVKSEIEDLISISLFDTNLYDYDSANGKPYKILFDRNVNYKVYDTSDNEVTELLNSNNVIKIDSGFWINCYGEKFANIAMRNRGLPWFDRTVKYEF